MIIDKFRAILKKRIKDVGFTQEEFAENIGISHAALKKYMSCGINTSLPSIDIFDKMCDVLDCDYEYLVGKIDTPHRDVFDVKQVTGLSDEAVTILKELFNNSPVKPNDRISLEVIDLILRNENSTCLLWNMGMYIYGEYINEENKKRLTRAGYDKENTLWHTVSLLDRHTGEEAHLDIKDIKEGFLSKVTHQLQNLKERIDRNYM